MAQVVAEIWQNYRWQNMELPDNMRFGNSTKCSAKLIKIIPQITISKMIAFFIENKATKFDNWNAGRLRYSLII